MQIAAAIGQVRPRVEHFWLRYGHTARAALATHAQAQRDTTTDAPALNEIARSLWYCRRQLAHVPWAASVDPPTDDLRSGEYYTTTGPRPC